MISTSQDTSRTPLWLVRERSFNTGGGMGKFGLVTQKKFQPLFAHVKKIQPPPQVHKKINTPPPLKLIFYVFTNSIVFHENSLFITFIKNVCQ